MFDHFEFEPGLPRKPLGLPIGKLSDGVIVPSPRSPLGFLIEFDP